MKAVPLSRSLAFVVIACLGCAVDLATKYWAFSALGNQAIGDFPDGGHTHWLWHGVFGFQTSLNEGALFGLGQGFVPVFAGLSILAAIAIFVWLFYAGAAHDWMLTIALGCVTGGIFGNLYDRLGMPHLVWNGIDGVHAPGSSVYAVRDYILVMFGSHAWPNFNIADSLLVCGAILLFWQTLRGHRAEKAALRELAQEEPAEDRP
jgi:signal peptidase II